MNKKSWLVAGCAALLLSACGGSDDTTNTTPAPTTSVPASVSESVSDFFVYLVSLLATPADTLEPVDVNSVTPAVSDTTEPTAIQ